MASCDVLRQTKDQVRASPLLLGTAAVGALVGISMCFFMIITLESNVYSEGRAFLVGLFPYFLSNRKRRIGL